MTATNSGSRCRGLPRPSIARVQRALGWKVLVGLGARDPARPQETDLLLVRNPLPGCGGQLQAGPSPAHYLCRVSQALQKQSSQEAHRSAWTSPGKLSEHTGSVTEGCNLERNCEQRSPRGKPGSCPVWGLPLHQQLLGITTCHSALCPLQKASGEGGLPTNLAEDSGTRASGEQGV